MRKLSVRASQFLAAIVFATVATVAGFGLSPDSSVQAYPSNCMSAFVANGAMAMCNGGTGEVQVVIGCKNVFGFQTVEKGPWVGVGDGESRTGCPIFYSVQWHGYYLRD